MHSSDGFALSVILGKHDEGVALIFSGSTRLLLGETDLAMERFTHAMRLSPLDPLLFLRQWGLARAYFQLGRYDEASSWARNALRENPKHHPALCTLAASNALPGRLL